MSHCRLAVNSSDRHRATEHTLPSTDLGHLLCRPLDLRRPEGHLTVVTICPHRYITKKESLTFKNSNEKKSGSKDIDEKVVHRPKSIV